jgi:hypothetical protein
MTMKIQMFLYSFSVESHPAVIELLPKKLSLSSQKYGFGIRDPGSRGPKGTGSRILDPRSRILHPRSWIPDPGSGSATLISTNLYDNENSNVPVLFSL